MQLIDSHCHLNLSAFNDDVEAAVQRAQAAGVEKMIVIGTNAADSIKAIELAQKRLEVKPV